MSLRGDCPVCGNVPLQPILTEFSITAALGERPEQHIGGLRAYQCARELHIFFVMSKDVEEANS